MGVVQFYPLDIRVQMANQRPVVVLYGRTTTGERVSVMDHDYLPYLYIVPKTQDSAELEQELARFIIKDKDNYCSVLKIEKMSMNFLEKETTVLKAFFNNPFGALAMHDELLKRPDIQGIYEHDVPFVSSYLLDKKIIPGVVTTVEGEMVNVHARVPVIRANSIMQAEDESIKNGKILAFDIETYAPAGKPASPEHDPIVMVSFYSNDFKKTITWKEFATTNPSLEFVNGEFELLMRFKKVIEEFQPDFLIGYTSDVFSFPYLKKRADKYDIKLDLGVDHSNIDVGKTATAIKGIVHVDLYKFVSRILSSKLETDTFRLEEVARELLGEGKKQIDTEHFAAVWDNTPENLEPYCEYNLQDAALIYKLFEKVLPSMFEFVKLTNVELFDMVRGSFSLFVEALLTKESRFWKEIIPPRPTRKEYEERNAYSYQGGFVSEPEPGIYNNIAVYDFASLYPSIISTHNISPGTLRCRCCTEIVPGEEMHFCKKTTGFFPKIVSGLVDRRQRILKILGDTGEKSPEQVSLLYARQEVLKIIANSLYGYFAFPSSRWYNLECAKAVTAYGRHYINSVIEKAKEDFEVLYADTDSVFLKAGGKKLGQSEKFFEELNLALPEKMKLEYEGLYPRGIFIASKAGKGAKKKYALLSEQGFLKIKGLESSRRNFSTLAKNAQEEVLYLILKERKMRKAVEYIRNLIGEVKEQKIPLRKMIIYTQLQKDIARYETIAPHVAVAKKMQQSGFAVGPGSLIQYVVAKGDGSIAERSQLPNEVREYDAAYYIEHQILPSVEKIFEAAGVDLMKALDEKEQSSLSEFI